MKENNTLGAEEATGIEAALELRGFKSVLQSHEVIHWDEANQCYLPSDYTYTVMVKVTDRQTGNIELETVNGRDDMEAAIARAKERLSVAARRTRRAIRAENQIS